MTTSATDRTAADLTVFNALYDNYIDSARRGDRSDVADMGKRIADYIATHDEFGCFMAQVLEDVRAIYAKRFVDAGTKPADAPEPVADGSGIVGTFTVVWADESHTTIRFKQGTGSFAGKTIVSYLFGPDNWENYKGFGHFDGSKFVLWKKSGMAKGSRPVMAISVVMGDPDKAREAYAIESGNCSRCGRKLTVPASLHRGLGPECAKKI